MNPQDAAALLAKCAAFDNRQPTKATTLAWSEALEDMPLVDALKFVTDHYATSREWIMPSDLNAAWRQLRRERQLQIPEAQRPVPPQDATGPEFVKFRQAVSRAIGRGATPDQAEKVAYAAIGRPLPAIEATRTHQINTDQIGKRL